MADTSHRTIAAPPYKALREIDGVMHKPCRWCDQLLLKPDGSPDLRRNWHPQCADDYLVQRSPAMLRRKTWDRDRGICSSCGRDTFAEHLAGLKVKPPENRLANEDWIRTYGLAAAWEADHITPLIDGGGKTLDNVQTLCTPCHRAKTAEENRQRFRAPSPQEALEAAGQLRLGVSA